MMHAFHVVAVLVAVTAVAAFGGERSLVRSQAGAKATQPDSCRIYSTAEKREFASSNGSLRGTITQTCRYAESANELTCTLDYSDASGFTFGVTEVARYASAADFVDEVRRVPPLTRAASGSTTYRRPGPGMRNSTWTCTYDSERRPTQRVVTFSDGSVQTIMNTAWDATGRPTRATLSTPPSELVYRDNDADRTHTITTPSTGAVQIHTYDTNGNLFSTVSTVGGMATTYRVTISATGRVCR